MRIGQIVASADPRLGGPSVSVPRMAEALSRLGHKVELLSTDSHSSDPEGSGYLTSRRFKRIWPEQLCISPELDHYLRNTGYDIMHSNGLWHRTVHYAGKAARRADIPHVLAPRGMLSPWAISYKRWRKRLAGPLIHPRLLSRVTAFHATSPTEADDIRKLGYTQPICVAPNGIDAPTQEEEALARRYWLNACPEAFERPTALFYSRFHRKKRLLELIDLWITEAPQDWLLLIVGFPQEYDVNQLNEYIVRNGGANNITVFDGSEAPPPYVAASLFLLPSFSESFGIVVAEALANGVPVLVTDTTPWLHVNETEFGWCGPWSEYRGALKDALALGPVTLRERGRQARQWVGTEYTWEKSAKTLTAFYESLK